MIRSILIAVLFLIVGASALAAQTAEQRIERARQGAAAAGIPVSLLESKVAEGRAKGVPMEQIAVAVERRLAALERARAAMRPREGQPSPAELNVGADALQSGVSEDALRTLSQSVPAEHRTVAIVVLTDLVQQGQSSQQALTRVQAALARGPDALRGLPAEAARERRGPPGERRARPPQASSNRGNSANAAGRQGGGPPAAVPAPGRGVGSENPGRGRGRGRGRDDPPRGPPGQP